MSERTQIKNRWTGKVIFEAEGDLRAVVVMAVRSGADLTGAVLSRANLSGADLTGVNLTRANLYGANLSGANLTRANLYGANLSGADLTGVNLTRANLYGANLYGVNLSGAVGINRFLACSLLLLREQPGPIRAYKLVDADYRSPIQSNRKLFWNVGAELEEADADTTDKLCAKGLNVATLDWCLREWREGWRIVVVEFRKEDIASIPLGTDGKFRLRKCKVVREVDLKAELNWPGEK